MAEREHPEPQQSAAAAPARKKANGSSVFQCADPDGYQITLSVVTWEDHICRRHPEMTRRLEQIKETISDPDLIQGEEASTTCFYYRLTGERFLKKDDLYIGVVIARDASTKTGVVKTCHLLRNLKPTGDKTLWMRSKPR